MALEEMVKISRSWLIGASLAVLTAGAPVQAQETQQTVEGAQAFLAELAQKGRLGLWLYKGGNNVLSETATWHKGPRRGQQEITRTWHTPYPIKSLSATNATGTASACFTKIEDLTFPPQKTSSMPDGSISWVEEDPKDVFKTPFIIDWSASSSRREGRYVEINSAGSEYKYRILLNDPFDENLLDRLEYAIKFIQLSCEPSSSTGF